MHEEAEASSEDVSEDDEDNDDDEDDDNAVDASLDAQSVMDVDTSREVKEEEPSPVLQIPGNSSSPSLLLPSPAPTTPPPSMVIVPPSPILDNDNWEGSVDGGTDLDRPMTQRGKKALASPAGTGNATLTKGRTNRRGKILIPGGRFKKGTGKKEEGKPPAEAAEAAKEWTTNGAGRVDVRGFRELKI